MIDNAPAVADPETFTIRRSVRINASLDAVWAAVTGPELISRWLGPTVLHGSGAGAHGTVTWPDGPAPIPLRIEAIDPPRSIAYRWNNDDARGSAPPEVEDATSTVFTFTLEPIPEGTRLTVVETGFEATSDPSANLASHQTGWTLEIDELIVLLEERP